MPCKSTIRWVGTFVCLLTGCGVDTGIREEPLVVDNRLSIITTRMGASRDILYSKVILQTDGKYAAAGESWVGVSNVAAITRFNADGSLDTSFATRGVVTTTFNSGAMYYALLLQTNARLVGAGTVATAGGDDFGLARYHTDGTLDTSFSTDGMVTYGFAANTQRDIGYNAALQTDGLIVAVGETGQTNDWVIFRLSTNGALDTAFYTSGYRLNNLGASDENAYSVSVTTDGKLVVIGQTEVSSEDDTGAARYNSDGTMDTSFHTDGVYAVSLDSGCDTALSLDIQTDGRYVLGGQVAGFGSNSALISRLNTDGTLDTSFFTSGTKKDTPFSTTQGFRILLDTNGKVMVSGRDGTNANAYVGRYSTDGTRDTTFNATGFSTLDFGGTSDLFYGLGILSSGQVMVAGTGGSGKKQDFVIARYFANGSLDTAFATRGYNSTSAGMFGAGTANGAAVQTDGAVVTVGEVYLGGNYTFAVTRHTFDGQLDTSFNTTGRYWDATVSTTGNLVKATVQTDGKIIASGVSAALPTDYYTVRFLTNGTLDTSFHTDGMSNLDDTSQAGAVYAILLQTNGRPVLAGTSDSDPAIVRLTTDGTFDTSFFTSGKANHDVFGTDGSFYDVAPLADGTVLGAGSLSGSGKDFLVARYRTDGVLDTGFYTAGSVRIVFGTGEDIAYTLSITPDNKIVAAGQVQPTATVQYHQGVVRIRSDGVIDTSFHTDGWVSFILGTLTEYPSRVVVQKNSKIVLGGRKTSASGSADMALVRLLPDGTFDTSFNTAGHLAHSLGATGSDCVTDIVLLTDGRTLGVGYGVKDGYQVFALMRYFP